MKVPASKFKVFWQDFFKNGKYPNQRLGQAFVNHFFGTGGGYQELFYEKDVHKAESYIWNNLIDLKA